MEAQGAAYRARYGSGWKQLRLEVLRAEPWCRACKEQGLWTPASEVDHIRPLVEGGTNDRSNLQPLCKPCHSRKTVLERRRRGEL